ncbi:chloride channel protein [Termitidicoccus mucosus]
MAGLLRRPWYRMPVELRQALALAVLGAGTGLVAVLFHFSVEEISRWTFVHFKDGGKLRFLLGSLGCVMAGVLVVTWLVRAVEPSCEGGGVMPTKLAFWKNFGAMRLRTAWVKFAGSAVTLGSGVSMGPEGPAVQIGAATMSAAAGRFGVPAGRRRAYAAAGAAAALAAVFNAPLTAIAFVLEEIIGDLSSRFIGGIVVAAVMGALVAHALIGPQPAFQAAPLGDASWRGMLLCPLVALLAALAGVGFQRGTLAVRGRFKSQRRIPGWARPALGALATWVLGGAAFLLTGRVGVFGVGYADVTACIQGGLVWWSALALGAAKLGATMLAVGASCCGGIFAPNLFVGAMCGGAVAGLAALAMPLTHSDQAMLVMAGMCACLGAVIRTPVSCILLIFEVTHQFAIVPLLLVATVVSQLVSRRLNREGMYEGMMRQDGEDPDRVLPPHDYHRWREIPCGALLERTPVAAASLEPGALRELLAAHPYERFPVRAPDGSIAGILTRREAERLIEEGGGKPDLSPAQWIPGHAPVALVQRMLTEAPENVLCVGDEQEQRLRGLLTAHDLLRGQIKLAEEEMGE